MERYFYTFLYTRIDQVVLEPLSQLCTFENSTKCRLRFFFRKLKGLLKSNLNFHQVWSFESRVLLIEKA